MKRNTLPAVTAVDAAPYVKELTSRTDTILKTFRAVKSARLSLVKQFAAGTFTSRVNLVREGELHCMRRLEACWHYLYFAGIPQSVSQIHEAVERGKCRSTAKDSLHATYGSLRYGAKRDRFRCVGRATNGESLWVIA